MDRPGRGFPRSSRLLAPADFKQVFDQPFKSADRWLTILGRANGLGRPRLGLAIAKRQVRKATDRNRLKRVIRESFRHRQDLGGMDLVVMARSAVLETNHESLFGALEKHWDRLVKQCKRCSSSSSGSTDT